MLAYALAPRPARVTPRLLFGRTETRNTHVTIRTLTFKNEIFFELIKPYLY